MFETQNKQIIRKLSLKSIKANKTRSIFIVFAIILTTYVLTTIFSIGVSYYQSYQSQKLRSAGMDADAELSIPTDEQIEKAKQIEDVKYIGLQIKCGKTMFYDTDTLVRFVLTWRDDVNWKKQSLPAFEYFVGTYPTAEDEVIMSEWALSECGIEEYSIGMEIPLIYNDMNGRHEKIFKLAGYYKDYTEELNPSGGIILVSEDFMKASGYSKTDMGSGKLYFTFNNQLVSSMQLNRVENELNLSGNQVFYADEEMFGTFLSTVIGITLLGILIMFCGCLLIYNVLHISIAADIRFYGLLKTTGLTSKQIRKMILLYVLYLAFAGIFTGLVLGGVTAFFIVPYILKAMSDYLLIQSVSFHPIIFIGAALFAFLTTIFGSLKPAKMAGNIEPVEAIKYTHNKSYKPRKKKRYGKNIYRMAWQNLVINKKRVGIVILSLFMGVTSFLAVNVIIKGNDIYNYIELYRDYEITLSNETGMSEDYAAKDKFDEGFMKQLAGIDGIKSIETISSEAMTIKYDEELFKDYLASYYELYMNESYEDGWKRIEEDPNVFQAQFIGVSEGIFDQINQSLDTPLNKEDFLEGKVCIIQTYQIPIENIVGKEVEFLFPDLDETEIHRMTIGAWSGTNISRYGGISPNIIVSDQVVESLVEAPWIEEIKINSEKSFNRILDTAVHNLIKEDSDISFSSKIQTYDSMQSSNTTLTVFGSGISIILACIGMLNFINVMIAGIYERRKDLAILESVGMTHGQMQKMLVIEGMFYASLSIISILTFGIAISMGIFYMLKEPHMVYQFPYFNIMIMVGIIVMICILVPVIVLRRLDKKSLVSRLI
jgi:putative ABC transport system permease protein